MTFPSFSFSIAILVLYTAIFFRVKHLKERTTSCRNVETQTSSDVLTVKTVHCESPLLVKQELKHNLQKKTLLRAKQMILDLQRKHDAALQEKNDVLDYYSVFKKNADFALQEQSKRIKQLRNTLSRKNKLLKKQNRCIEAFLK